MLIQCNICLTMSCRESNAAKRLPTEVYDVQRLPKALSCSPRPRTSQGFFHHQPPERGATPRHRTATNFFAILREGQRACLKSILVNSAARAVRLASLHGGHRFVPTCFPLRRGFGGTGPFSRLAIGATALAISRSVWFFKQSLSSHLVAKRDHAAFIAFDLRQMKGHIPV